MFVFVWERDVVLVVGWEKELVTKKRNILYVIYGGGYLFCRERNWGLGKDGHFVVFLSHFSQQHSINFNVENNHLTPSPPEYHLSHQPPSSPVSPLLLSPLQSSQLSCPVLSQTDRSSMDWPVSAGRGGGSQVG